ncbi:bifunctional glutamate N-acetyltransferase/amino-acid acetyltransferase ArgJ [Staphylococcus simulans]|uniref:bifunctional glutamate N-acetyltransferase/amino-acid acetyltransferase ArgJ n=1 Tax=Staphylococcus simulans TaxID=1286 RepID=UPI001E3CD995|nr:bifunctional glutamate N-acetyltransferase/amino-acid acetyltransferase ArgJ [Staphylococcus simulans]MCD8914777.1 bifunctional glutamate N-acetyltransferase/amino-acid acetyltransferase ArgJ [Staphylococcus simulans]
MNTTQHAYKVIEAGDAASPKGFSSGGVHAGLKKKKRDFGWIVSEVPANAAGVYTVNPFKAAPLKVTEQTVKIHQTLRAIVVNSGVANACTGPKGYRDALAMRSKAAQELEVPVNEVAIASTGVIGTLLPMDAIYYGCSKIKEAAYQNSQYFNEAILTTDTTAKHIAVEVEIDHQIVTIGGTAKGSGMIHPNMATMLGFMTTDAVIDSKHLQGLLKEVVDDTFNMITVDGDTSTNDMVLVLANGKVSTNPLTPEHPAWNQFKAAFLKVAKHLAIAIAKDGEGATKLVKVKVTGAPTKTIAGQTAKGIISSNLVKTALFGEDPNVGRLSSAIGNFYPNVRPNEVNIWLCGTLVVNNGLPADFNESDLKAQMGNHIIDITATIGKGKYEQEAFGCDLSYDYVRINASYRT